MRVLLAGPDHERDRADPGRAGGRRSRARSRRDERQSLPLRRLSRDHRSDPRGAERPRPDGSKECGSEECGPEGCGMNVFGYVRPATIAEAVAAASEPGSAYLAGGTNLL